MKNKAVIFDRDDTLIQDKNYMHDPKDLKFFDDTFSALKEIQNKDYLLFIITNQSGIGRGYFKQEDMEIFNQKMLAELNKKDIHIKAIKFCPHSPEDHCDCRKPKPTLILELIDEFKLDPTQSFIIGDKLSDAQAGKNAGINGVLLKKQDKDFLNFNSLSDFANYLK